MRFYLEETMKRSLTLKTNKSFTTKTIFYTHETRFKETYTCKIWEHKRRRDVIWLNERQFEGFVCMTNCTRHYHPLF